VRGGKSKALVIHSVECLAITVGCGLTLVGAGSMRVTPYGDVSEAPKAGKTAAQPSYVTEASRDAAGLVFDKTVCADPADRFRTPGRYTDQRKYARGSSLDNPLADAA